MLPGYTSRADFHKKFGLYLTDDDGLLGTFALASYIHMSVLEQWWLYAASFLGLLSLFSFRFERFQIEQTDHILNRPIMIAITQYIF